VPLLGAFMYNAIYKFPAYRFECNGVFTNTTKTDAYRGAGRPEATYAIERIMDELAIEVGRRPHGDPAPQLDPARRSSRSPRCAACPTTQATTRRPPTRRCSCFGYDELRAEQNARRAANDPVQLGIGISTYTEMCGLAPSRLLGQLRYGAGGWESVTIRMLATGKVEVVSGSTPHGQGHDTAWSQIVSDQLGIPFEDITVLHGDTRVAAKGMDTYGSRSLAVGRRGHGDGLREGTGQGEARRRAPARVLAQRPRVHRRQVPRAGQPGGGPGHGGDLGRGLRRAQPAGRHGTVAGLRGDVRPGELLVPARDAPVRGRRRHGDRPGLDPQVRGGRRRRQGDQSR
jgi:CO/xanthine dehydrogenase Mo-binding subunit